MNFNEIEKSLPNGFHDAKMESFYFNYARSEIKILLDIWVGSPQDKEKYRSAELYIQNIDFCIMDIPDKNYPYQKKGALTIDAVPEQPKQSFLNLPPHKLGHFLFTIWVNEWNAFIRIAAEHMQIKWLQK
jgi:hypothetical protein